MEILDDIVGVSEAAELLGVEKGRISRWQTRGVVLPDGRRVLFPKPIKELRATPIWRRSDIEKLRDARNAPRTIEQL
jgi:hypothetical protein